MRVLHLLDAAEMFGAAAVVRELALAQIANGYEVKVVVLQQNGMLENAVIDRCIKDDIPAELYLIGKLPSPLALKNFKRFIARFNPHVIHGHNYKSNILLACLSKIWRQRCLSTHHGYTATRGSALHKLYYALDGIALGRLGAIIAVSNAAKSQLPAKLQGRCRTIHNGLPETPCFESNSSSNRRGAIRIGALGRLAEEKNYSLLITAVKALHVKHANIRLLLAGTGPLESALRAQALQLDIDGHLDFLGFVDNQDSFLRGLDVFVNCSKSEGMPISILEAMRAGTPIVASNIAANRELLAHDSPAVLFELNDSSGLSDAIDSVLNWSVAKRENAAALLREQFGKRYTIEKMVSNYDAVYREVAQH